MSETFDGRKSPFDLFGPPAQREAEAEDPGVDLPRLMREEAGRTSENDVRPAAVETPFPEDPDEDLPGELPAPSLDQAVPAARPAGDPPESEPWEPVPAQPAFADPEAQDDSRPEDSPDPAPETGEPVTEWEAPIAPVESIRPPVPVDARQLWLLRVLLGCNLAMMIVMLVLPHPMEPRTDTELSENLAPPVGTPPSAVERPPSADPLVSTPRAQSLGLPDDAVYERALLLALDGDFDGACAQLQGLLTANPDMNPAVARLVHAHLAYYLRKAGRLAEALEHERLARQEADRAALPEELLEEARAAEARGDGDAMRRAYARFLLQEGQLPPDMRAMVLEVLTKLGDSYRVQADAGQERPEGRSR